MKISQAGIDLIKSFEGLELKAYMPTAEDVPTIGFGHTQFVKMGDTCTETQAEAWLREDVEWAEDCVNNNVKVDLAQNEFDAVVSLVFNIGCTAFRTSTMLKLLNAKDLEGAKNQFRRWNRQKGEELAGLTRRRAAEERMFA